MHAAVVQACLCGSVKLCMKLIMRLPEQLYQQLCLQAPMTKCSEGVSNASDGLN